MDQSRGDIKKEEATRNDDHVMKDGPVPANGNQEEQPTADMSGRASGKKQAQVITKKEE